MNIFYLHPNPNLAPTYLYNKHCVKMILETAQMLCSAHHYYADINNTDKSYIPYKPAYIHHPSTKWARLNKQTYKWLYDYFVSINIEYNNRYGKIHTTWIKCKNALANCPKGMPNGKFIQPPQCMPDIHKKDCSIDAYWDYYIKAKSHIANKTENKYTQIYYDIIKASINL